jgi:hypothetical protein
MSDKLLPDIFDVKASTEALVEKTAKALDNSTQPKRSFAERPGYFRGAKVRKSK